MRVKIPCSTANIGPGFDVLGLALSMYLEVSLELAGDGLEISSEGVEIEKIPSDASNMIYQTLARVVGAKLPKGIRLHIKNEIPLARGFGSSAAATVAGVALGLWLRDGKIPEQQNLLEVSASEEGHPDNVAPSILGGMTASALIEGRAISSRIVVNEELKIVAWVPAYELSTKLAREALPKELSYSDAIFNLQRMALLITSLASGDKQNIRWGVEDRLHQMYRAKLMPGTKELLESLREEPECWGVFVSGAGPTASAFTKSDGKALAEKGLKIYEAVGIEATYKILKPELKGIQFFES